MANCSNRYEARDAWNFEAYNVELIASLPAIEKAEDRQAFKKAMTEIGLESARSGCIRHVTGLKLAEELGFHCTSAILHLGGPEAEFV